MRPTQTPAPSVLIPRKQNLLVAPGAAPVCLTTFLLVDKSAQWAVLPTESVSTIQATQALPFCLYCLLDGPYARHSSIMRKCRGVQVGRFLDALVST